MKTKKDLLNITDLSRDEILEIFSRAQFYKARRRNNQPVLPILKGRTIGLFFRKPSSRTRISFEVAIYELGGKPLFMSAEQLQLSRGETISDTAKVFDRYLNGLVIRTFEQEEIEEFAGIVHFPVINALTDLFHPCQILADFFTIWERRKNLKNLTLTYIGDGNNVCNTIILGADVLGMRCNVATPPQFRVQSKIWGLVKNKKLFREGTNPADFIPQSDIIYTDTWVSMGDEEEAEKRRKIFQPFQVNSDLLKNAPKNYMFMHCLPAHRGWEVTGDILDGAHSIVWDQTENRLHIQKAIFHFLYARK
jgi:ornithine carbamoyltransferase